MGSVAYFLYLLPSGAQFPHVLGPRSAHGACQVLTEHTYSRTLDVRFCYTTAWPTRRNVVQALFRVEAFQNDIDIRMLYLGIHWQDHIQARLMGGAYI